MAFGDPITCDNCGSVSRSEGGPVQIDAGLVVDVRGGYGMFEDNLDVDNHRFVICHDCSLLLFRQFPMLGKRFGDKGLHSRVGGILCCEYSWTIYEGEVLEGMPVIDPGE